MIQSGQVYEFNEYRDMSIYIIEPAQFDNMWSVFDYWAGVMYNLEDDYIRTKFSLSEQMSEDYIETMRKRLNPVRADLTEANFLIPIV